MVWYEMQEKNGEGFGDNNMAMRHHPRRDKSAEWRKSTQRIHSICISRSYIIFR